MCNQVNIINQRTIKLLKTLLPLIIFFFSITACGGEKEIPGAQIAGIRTTIRRILISPLAFDGAQVAVEGIAHDIDEGKTDEGLPIIIFKLSDLGGNFVNVSTPSSWVVMEDDYMVVGGIYRRARNEIEATQLEVIVLEEDNKDL